MNFQQNFAQRSSRAARGMMCAASLVGLASCERAVLDPVGPIGMAERTILIDSMIIMLAIVLPTIAATLAFAWWFRDSNTRAKRLPHFAYSGRIELVTWSIPLLTIMLLGGVIWIGSHQLDPAEPIASDAPPLDVQVVSLDWKWLFIYPGQQVASVNELVIPTGVPVRFSITSASVMTAFFVPRLGSMIYAMNGMATTLNLRADEAGTYRGMASHYSGDGFSDMHFGVQAKSPADFQQWVEATRGHGPTLDDGAYAKLAQQGVEKAPWTFGGTDKNMFQKIVTQALAPGPGPVVGDITVHPKERN